MTSYWNKILEEVLNKHDPRYPALFTTAKEQVKSQDIQASKIKKLDNPTNPAKSAPKKHTQIAGTIKKYRLGEKFAGIYFTKREAQIAFYFVHGMSATQVAKVLKLSRRTVEFYVNNMKIKLNCRLKSELVDIVIQSDFLKMVDFNPEIPSDFCKPLSEK